MEWMRAIAKLSSGTNLEANLSEEHDRVKFVFTVTPEGLNGRSSSDEPSNADSSAAGSEAEPATVGPSVD